MKNLLSYCELTDARRRASEKDLPGIFPISNASLAILFATSFTSSASTAVAVRYNKVENKYVCNHMPEKPFSLF